LRHQDHVESGARFAFLRRCRAKVEIARGVGFEEGRIIGGHGVEAISVALYPLDHFG
jgi:hypothetical protein